MVEFASSSVMSTDFNFTDAIAIYIHARFIWNLDGGLSPQPVPHLWMPVNVVLDCELLAQQAAEAYRNPSKPVFHVSPF